MNLDEALSFRPGDRVRRSEVGRRTFRQAEAKFPYGEFRGWTRSMFARVLWDGRSTEQALHPDFIEHDDGAHCR